MLSDLEGPTLSVRYQCSGSNTPQHGGIPIYPICDGDFHGLLFLNMQEIVLTISSCQASFGEETCWALVLITIAGEVRGIERLPSAALNARVDCLQLNIQLICLGQVSGVYLEPFTETSV